MKAIIMVTHISYHTGYIGNDGILFRGATRYTNFHKNELITRLACKENINVPQSPHKLNIDGLHTNLPLNQVPSNSLTLLILMYFLHDMNTGLLQLSFQNNTTLLWIGLGSNHIGAEGVWALTESLKTNISLLWIGLGGNELGDKGALHLATLLQGEERTQTLAPKLPTTC